MRIGRDLLHMTFAGPSTMADGLPVPEGRAQNRRVVMKVLSNPGSVEIKGDGRP
jgi:hypothetical protein